MNTKKIKLHDRHYNGMPLCDASPPQQLLSSAAKQLPASAGLPPFHQGLVSPLPHQQQQQHGGAGWLHEEYTAPRSAFAQSCVGSNTAAFYAAENLLGMAQFDCPPLGMLPAMMPTAAAKTAYRSSTDSDQLYRPLDPLLHHANQSSVRSTYYVRPQRRDAAIELPLPSPQQQQQERAHHGMFANASATRLLGGEPKTHPFSPHVRANQIAPAMEAQSLQSQMENHLSRSCAGASATTPTVGNGGAPPAAPSKTRIRWTQDLHEHFVDCVSQLGGAEKATPKGILKLMNSDGLTIYHIKSHLQKYRIAKYMPASSSSSPEGKQQEKRAAGIDVQNLDPKTGTQITEALRVQLDVQRRLHEQLEIQRTLQLRIEAQGKRLQRMFEEQLKASGNGNGNATESRELDDVVFPAAEQDDVAFDDDEVQLLSVASSSYEDAHGQNELAL